MSVYPELFILPLGYVDQAGVRHHQVELAPLRGLEEEFVAHLGMGANTSAVVTALLATCVRRIGSVRKVTSKLIAELLVGDREFLMMKLREITFGRKLGAVLFCADSACGKPMDIAIDLDQFAPTFRGVFQRIFALQVPAGEDEGEGFSLKFRLPTGADQEMSAAPEDTVDRLLAGLLISINGETAINEERVRALPVSVKRAIETEMERLAPNFTIELETACPECGKTSTSPFDLTTFFLSEIGNNLRNLEWEVHFLASHYHWPEREILALPRRRRQRFIQLIQGESFWTQESFASSRRSPAALEAMLNP